MERATEFPLPLLGLAFASRYQLKHPLTPESQVYFPGNDRHGIWSAKQLATVVPPTWAPGYPNLSDKVPAVRVVPEGRTVETKKVSAPGGPRPKAEAGKPRTDAVSAGAGAGRKGT